MKIKICGLTSLEDIQIINEFMPDYAGFIFAKQSKRKTDEKQAEEMKSLLNPAITSAGVFVNANPNEIIHIAKTKIIDIIQLHGDEDNDFIKRIRQKTSLPVIKAFKADSFLNENIKSTIADFILIDSYNKDSFGGTGKTFDWGLIPETTKPYFLAGGLNSDNIKKAIETLHPYCLDLNSGVETNGKKDKQKISNIIQIIKGYKNE